MAGFKLSQTSIANLKGVHRDLVRVVMRAAEISPIPFKVNEGLRSVAKQKENIKKGVSKTMNSRHLTGHAVDLVPMEDTNKDGTVSSEEQWAWPVYHRLAPYIKQAAKELGVSVGWGGDWKSWKDGPHWELTWAAYPVAQGLADYNGVPLGKYLADEKMDPETEHGAAVKATGYAGGAAATGVAIAADPVATLVDSLMQQQYELTSGDIVRLVLAVTIIGLGFWAAYRASRG